MNDNSLTIEPASADDSKYMIYSRMEIAAILARMRDAASRVRAYLGSDRDFILTSIVSVMPEQGEVIIACDVDTLANERALRAEQITFVSMLDRIKIQFVAKLMGLADVDGRQAFSLRMPAALLRLQRRENFRLATASANPLICVIGPQAGPGNIPISATIVDISCGGIAVEYMGPADLQTGAHLRGCRIVLPKLGEIAADVMVKNTFEVTLKSGGKRKRAGCAFVDLPEPARALIQRYIDKLVPQRRHYNRAAADRLTEASKGPNPPGAREAPDKLAVAACSFQSMQLQVGARLQFLPAHAGRKAALFSTLIGYEPAKYIIAKIPYEKETGSFVPLKEGGEIRIRVFTGERIFSFVSIVDRVFRTMPHYVHLSYPHSVDVQRLRNSVRVEVDLPGFVRTTVESSEQILPVQLVNISVGGAGVLSTQRLGNVGNHVHLSFEILVQPGDHLANINTNALLRGENTVNSAAQRQPGTIFYGIQFDEMNPTQMIALQNFIYQRQIGNGRKVV